MKLWALLIAVFVGSVMVQGKYYEIDDVDFYPYPVAAGADFYNKLAVFKRKHAVGDLKPLNDSLTTYKQQLASCILFQTSSPIINLGWSKIVLRMCSEGYINAKKSLEAIDQCATQPKDLHRTEVTRKAELKDTTFKKEWTIGLFCGSNKASSAFEKTYRLGKSMTKLFWVGPRKAYHRRKHKRYYDLHTEFRKHFDQNYRTNDTSSSKSDRPTIRHTDDGVAVIQARYKNYSDFSSISSCQNDCVGPQFYPLPIFVDNPNHGGVVASAEDGEAVLLAIAVLGVTYLFSATSTLLVGGGYKLVHTINKSIETKKEIRGLYTLDKNDVKMAHGAIELLCKELPVQSRPPVCKNALPPLNGVELHDIAQVIAPPAYDEYNQLK